MKVRKDMVLIKQAMTCHGPTEIKKEAHDYVPLRYDELKLQLFFRLLRGLFWFARCFSWHCRLRAEALGHNRFKVGVKRFNTSGSRFDVRTTIAEQLNEFLVAEFG